MSEQLLANITNSVFLIIIYLISISVHEMSHGYVAYRLGDPTAYNFGRLSLNPLKHIDPIGLIMVIVFRVGWARPVQINTRYFRKPRRDVALTAAAGPLSNVLLAFFAILLCHISLKIMISISAPVISIQLVYLFFNMFAMVNLSLAFFNMIPIPPLDGSRIMDLFLSPRMRLQYAKLQRYGFVILIMLLYTGILTTPLGFVTNGLYRLFEGFFNLFPFLRYINAGDVAV